MRWRLTLPLLLVVAAGCSGVTGPDDAGPGTQVDTLTPVPVTDSPGGVSNGTRGARLAPGLAADGVADPVALAGAHARALTNRSYTRVTHTTIEGRNGSLRVTRREVAVSPGGHRYHLVETSESSPAYPVDAVAPRLEVWYDGGPGLFRVGVEPNVTYRVGTTGSLNGPLGDLTGHDRLLGLYGTVDRWAVRPVTGPDATGYVLTSAEPPDREALLVPLFMESPAKTELQVVVTDSGRVVSLELAYEATFDGQPVRVVRRTRFVRVGNTTVPQPAWHGEARDATTDETATV